MAQHAKDKDVTYDSQRRRIEKLMKNPDKVIELPDTSLSIGKKYEPPDFVRNVMGSSAGAGSGEFHVYRHLRRKEMTRLKEMEESAVIDELNQEYKSKLDCIKREAELKSSKKKQKRDKKRERMKQKRLKKNKIDIISSNSFELDKNSHPSDDDDHSSASSKQEAQPEQQEKSVEMRKIELHEMDPDKEGTPQPAADGAAAAAAQERDHNKNNNNDRR